MIYRKSKPKNIFFTPKSDLYKFIQKESNEITIKEQKNIYSTISNIFNSVYEDFFPTIISSKEKDTFIKQINEQSMNIIHNNFDDNELQNPSIEEIIKNVKEEIQNKIKRVQLYLEKSINRTTRKEHNLSYLNHFRKHCIRAEDLAYHLCDNGKIGKFFILEKEKNENEKDICYIICQSCHFCYLSNCIRMYCIFCKKNYYSSVLKKSENVNCLPATWDSYHCGTRKKEIMKCLKCKDILYLNLINNRLICLNKKCNFSSKPEHIVWGCHLCGADFKSQAKIYNPLDYLILKKVINRALLYKIKASPPLLPCCLRKLEENTIFYHNKNCEGKLYKYNLDGRDLVVCEKCQALNKFNHFSWLCPFCFQNFTLNKGNNANIKKHFYSTSALNIHVKSSRELVEIKSLNENNKNTSSSVIKSLDNSSSFTHSNIFGFKFYAKKREANEYAKSKSQSKIDYHNSFDNTNLSEINIKNTNHNDECIDMRSKSIDLNKGSKRRIRNKKTLKEILNLRKNTPSFGKKIKDKGAKKEDELANKTSNQTEMNLLNNNHNQLDKVINVDNLIKNGNKINITNDYSKNQIIYQRMKRSIKDNNDSFGNDKERYRKVKKYINITRKNNKNSQEIDIN